MERVVASLSVNAMPIAVRAAGPEEAEPIRFLMRTVVETSVDASLQAAILENVEANLAAWLDRPATVVHLVAVANRSIVGVVLVKDFWNLCSLFVDPSQQRQGIGRSLLEAAAAACTPRSPRSALVLNAYPDAIGFYERLGFARKDAVQPSGIQRMERAFERPAGPPAPGAVEGSAR